MALSKSPFCITLLTLSMVMSLKVLPSCSYTSFVFGDSLVDAGNNDYIFTLSKADSPPYGIDFSASGGRPTGRFTNGRTVTDILGEELGAISFPLPYLAPASDKAVFGGLNYASGASGILDETGYLFVGRVPLEKQIDYFEQSRDYMVKMVAVNHTNKYLKSAIFSVATGSNDIMNYIQPSIPFFRRSKSSPSKFQDVMVSTFKVQLKRLYELGARKFVIVGVGPLGCIPFVRALRLLPSGRCSTVVNNLTQDYNMKLRKMLDQLTQELGPNAVFVYANSYKIVKEIMQHNKQYGFENAYDPCCGGSLSPFLCFKRSNPNISSTLCEDRSKYVFWDAFHPTEAANIIVARKLLDGDESVVSPMNIRELYYYTA